MTKDANMNSGTRNELDYISNGNYGNVYVPYVVEKNRLWGEAL